MESDSARGAIQPGLKILARFAQAGLGFSKLRWNMYNINLNADQVKQREAVREAMNSASLKIYFLFLQVRLSG